MPGLAGYSPSEGNLPARSVIDGMCQAMTHRKSFLQQEVFLDGRLAVGGCRAPSVPYGIAHSHQDQVSAWLDGEWYNLAGVRDECRLQGPMESDCLIQAYGTGRLNTLLEKVDGLYNAVIYDQSKNLLALVMDRYGLRHLFWTHTHGTFAFAQEVKAFLALESFSPKIDEAALSDFFRYNCMMGDKTWFQGVSLLPPSAILWFDFNTRATRLEFYWDWKKIVPAEGSGFKIGDFAAEWKNALDQACSRRVRDNERPGIFLSGGLDSRSLVAAYPDSRPPLQAVTFGRKGCVDVDVAGRVARRAGIRHHVFELRQRDWFMPRLKGVWWADGEISLVEMHGMEYLEDVAGLFTLSFNGLGGGFHSGWLLQNGMGEPSTSLDNPFGDYGRRTARRGASVDEPFMYYRAPLYDNALVELTLRAPRSLLSSGRLYRAVLSRSYPDFFDTIPYANSGVAVGFPWPVYEFLGAVERVKRKVLRVGQRLGLSGISREGYADYAALFQDPGTRRFFKRLITSNSALYPEFISRKKALEAWEQHPSRPELVFFLGKVITFEVYLQQVYNRALRDESSLEAFW